jgi:hypothetical protein
VDHNLKEEVEKLADDKNNIEITIRKSDKLEIPTPEGPEYYVPL